MAAVIEFRVLGSTELRSASGAQMHTILRRPKQLALLAYLLIAQPHRSVRREQLLGLFWPDRVDFEARHALRQALYELRLELGPALVVRDPQNVGIAPESIRCDAIAFEDALRDGDLATAVKLCRGDLLENIRFRAVSSEFQDWLDRERWRFRATAARAACGLAERTASDGDATSAVRWGRRATDLAPLEESVLHRVLAVYRQVGHRAAAERLFREFEKRIRLELELEPSAETRSLIQAIRGLPTTQPSPLPR